MSINHDTWPRWTVACPEYVVSATYATEKEALALCEVLDSEPVNCPYEHHAVQVNSAEEFRAMRQRRIYAESTKEEGENT